MNDVYDWCDLGPFYRQYLTKQRLDMDHGEVTQIHNNSWDRIGQNKASKVVQINHRSWYSERKTIHVIA